jgi:hypothetical protein
VSANAAGVNAARFKIATIPKSAIPRDGSVSSSPKSAIFQPIEANL